MKKKLLFVMFHLPSGGAEHALINLLSSLSIEEFDIDLLLFSKSGVLLKSVPNNVRILEVNQDMKELACGIPIRHLFKHSINQYIGIIKYQYYKRIKNIKNSYLLGQYKWKFVLSKSNFKITEHYDVSIAYMHSLPSYFVINNIINTEKKYLWIHHNYADLHPNIEFDLSFFEKADQILTISEMCVNVLRKKLPTLVDKIQLMENINSIDSIIEKSKQFYPKEFLPDILNFVTVGRFCAEKGYDNLVCIAEQLKKMGLKFRWFILGNGQLFENIKNSISEKKLDDYVKLLGLVSNPYPYISNADLVIQTSISEGKSMVLDEAKILNKIIISSDYDSVHDQLVNGENGVISSMAPKKFADVIISTINDENIKEKILQNLKETNYNYDNILKKHLKLFIE